MNVLCLIVSFMIPSTASPAEPAVDLEGANPGKEKKGEDEKKIRMTLKRGLEAIRKEYRPLLLVYLAEPEPPPDGFAAGLKKMLERRDMQKILRAYVRVDLDRKTLDSPYPAGRAGSSGKPGEKKQAKSNKPAGEKLGIVPAVPALVVLDYRERVVRRYREKLPGPDTLRRELRRIALHISRLAERARRVEKVIEQAEYSYTLGETRAAVQRILPLDDANLKKMLDSALAERLDAVLDRYKSDAADAMAIGEALEAERRFLEAVKAYQKAAFKYPFPEILKTSAIRQGTAMRKARGGV